MGKPQQYRYYDKMPVGLDVGGMPEDIKNAPDCSIISCSAHNPSSVDATCLRWKQIAQVIKEKVHFSFFDIAYQGFASGKVDQDPFVPQYFISQGLDIVISQLFAKNISLYGERCGYYHERSCTSNNREQLPLSSCR
ncbi:hypothetical protein MJO28_014622 [Puccinia striiformis f. sp. tritici]|uniref:Aminotransferase class I/classII large domain-containing protein n=2 Tax=Puccinia striiformis TaxID=27350 RepID=A0A2S4UBX3_9BASI|nr:hypothetical protein MJO28_014622 [Puccinia striiformis f. sp. tritici]KAI7941723.1 hypothetical protein MJO29_013797 [Puccinia striiformis f. sp. tritici]POV94654.1 hypothetical protein PSTT_16745 [Puccinia striiformis]